MGAYEGYTFLPEIFGRSSNRADPMAQFNFMSGRFNDLIGPLLQRKLDNHLGLSIPARFQRCGARHPFAQSQAINPGAVRNILLPRGKKVTLAADAGQSGIGGSSFADLLAAQKV